MTKTVTGRGLYKRLFDAATEGLVVVDQQGKINLVNPRVTELFGYSQEELIGEKVEVLIPEKARSRHKKHRSDYADKPARRLMGKGRDLKAMRKDGTTFPVEISLNPFKMDGERFVMALLTDITERKAAEDEVNRLNEELEEKVAKRTAALEQSQLMYQLIARNFPRGTINVLDRDLKYIFVEGQELYKLGVSGEKLIGQSYLDRIPQELSPLMKERLDLVFKGVHQTFDVEYNGRSYTISAVPLLEEDGVVQNILMVENNISELKAAQEEIKSALEKERDLNEMKSRFVSMASHEFRTPLSTILSSSSLLERYNEKDLPDKRKKHIQRIKNQVKNLTNILNDVLSLSKLEEGVIEPEIKTVDLGPFIEEVGDDVDGLKKSGQKYTCEMDGDCTKINTDLYILKNIMLNLLSNAIKYSGDKGQIKLTVNCNEDGFNFTVWDNGMGIPEDEQEKLFERFFRAGNVVNIEGTGLGLNIVKRYVELLDGNITFESSEDKGTEFSVYLPSKLATKNG